MAKKLKSTRIKLANGMEQSQVLDETIVAWDGGNGMSSAWVADEKGLRYASLPNARVPVTGHQLGRDVTAIDANEVHWMETVEGRFGIGDRVWEAATFPPETFTNSADRYGSEMHIFMLLSLLAILEVPTNTELTIVTSAPPAIVDKVSMYIKKRLTSGQAGDGSGVWAIKASWDNKRASIRNYVISRVVVLPEGMGAVGAYSFDLNGQPMVIEDHKGEDYLGGLVAVHDAGYGTWDNYTLRNGKLNLESMVHSTDSTAGIMQHMIEPIRNYIRQQFIENDMQAPVLFPVQIDSWLRAWTTKREALVQLNGMRLDLGGIFEQTAFSYARYIYEQKIEPTWRQGADAIVAVGGGWIYVIDPIIEHYDGRRILHPGIVPHLRGIPIWELNAYGALPITASNLARRKARR